MKLIDRYIIKSFVINYLLALCVMIGMYILLDIIVNFDLFTRGLAYKNASALTTFLGLMHEIISYYLYRSLVIFQMVSGVIPVIAAGFTMVRMTRNRELTALLASGVSLYRVAVPIIVCAVFFALLVVVDQEVLMPHCVDKLLRKHGQLTASILRDRAVYFLPESDHSLILASRYDPKTKTLWNVRIIERSPGGSPIGRIMAKKAVWKSHIGEGPVHGAWLMSDVVDINDRNAANPGETPIPVRHELYYTPLNPGQLNLIFQKKAVDYLSTSQISKLMLYSPPATRIALAKIMYTRFSQIIMNIIMLLLGIPFLLTREPNKLVSNMFWCSLISGVCFITTFVFFQLAGSGLSPLVGAAMPVIIFGPIAVIMFDLLQT